MLYIAKIPSREIHKADVSCVQGKEKLFNFGFYGKQVGSWFNQPIKNVAKNFLYILLPYP